jgi:hypothetical protein
LEDYTATIFRVEEYLKQAASRALVHNITCQEIELISSCFHRFPYIIAVMGLVTQSKSHQQRLTANEFVAQLIWYWYSKAKTVVNQGSFFL